MNPETNDEPSVNLWRLVDDRLKGRWWMAIGLAGVLGVGAAVTLYRTSVPQYRATGLVRIHPQLTPVLHETAETRNLPMYDTYKRTYAALVTEGQTLAAAVEDPELDAISDGIDGSMTEWLRDGLQVESARTTELVRVHFSDPSRTVAHAAVNSILRAFEAVHAETPTRQLAAARDVLVAEQLQDRAERDDLQRRLEDIASRFEFGAASFEEGLEMRLVRVAALDAQLEESRSVLAARRGENGEASVPVPLDPSDADLDRIDPALVGLRQIRDELRSRVAVARERWTEENRMRARLERELVVAESLFEETLARARERWSTLDPSLRQQDVTVAVLDDASLERRIAELEGRLDKDRAWVREASRARRESMILSGELEIVESRIATIDARIDELQREVLDRDGGALQGRFTVVPAAMPTSPDLDRRKKLAAAGLVAGVGTGFALVLLVGTLDRRAFATVQMGGLGTVRSLGVLPSLGKRASSEQEEVAAHCVHQIRNRIDAHRGGTRSGAFVLAVTSPYQGDGKTSMAVALAWSYARSGSRTLMIDCDLVGEGLSEQAGVLGRPGLREIVSGSGEIADLAIDLPGAPLAVVPAGERQEVGAERLSRSVLQRIVADAGRDRDVVILDCGPAPGSLETVPVIAAADATLLVVMRGRSQSRLESSIELIDSVGGRAIGMVLNCADSGECERYVSSSAVSSRRIAGGERDTPLQAARRSALVRSLAPRNEEDAA